MSVAAARGGSHTCPAEPEPSEDTSAELEILETAAVRGVGTQPVSPRTC